MSKNRQLDLFVALIGDVPFRDEREAMSAPLVALSKNKRTRIEWEGPSGQRVLVTAPEAVSYTHLTLPTSDLV